MKTMKEFCRKWAKRIATKQMALIAIITLTATLIGMWAARFEGLKILGALIIALLIGMVVDVYKRQKLFRYAQEKGIVIDTLVNCAGFGDWADFMHEDRRKLNAMRQVNMVTLAKLMRLFGEDMVGRHGGRILNICLLYTSRCV